jgi:hypothetical protein
MQSSLFCFNAVYLLGMSSGGSPIIVSLYVTSGVPASECHRVNGSVHYRPEIVVDPTPGLVESGAYCADHGIRCLICPEGSVPQAILPSCTAEMSMETCLLSTECQRLCVYNAYMVLA